LAFPGYGTPVWCLEYAPVGLASGTLLSFLRVIPATPSALRLAASQACRRGLRRQMPELRKGFPNPLRIIVHVRTPASGTGAPAAPPGTAHSPLTPARTSTASSRPPTTASSAGASPSGKLTRAACTGFAASPTPPSSAAAAAELPFAGAARYGEGSGRLRGFETERSSGPTPSTPRPTGRTAVRLDRLASGAFFETPGDAGPWPARAAEGNPRRIVALAVGRPH